MRAAVWRPAQERQAVGRNSACQRPRRLSEWQARAGFRRCDPRVPVSSPRRRIEAYPRHRLAIRRPPGGGLHINRDPLRRPSEDRHSPELARAALHLQELHLIAVRKKCYAPNVDAGARLDDLDRAIRCCLADPEAALAALDLHVGHVPSVGGNRRRNASPVVVSWMTSRFPWTTLAGCGDSDREAR